MFLVNFDCWVFDVKKGDIDSICSKEAVNADIECVVNRVKIIEPLVTGLSN